MKGVDDDHYVLEQLRNGNEDAFVALVDRYANALFRLALAYVKTRTVAEEVVQETWLAVLTGLNNFRGESPLKIWIFRILTSRAKTRAQRERRTRPFSSLETMETDLFEPAVAPDRFLPANHQWSGHWVSLPFT